MSINHLTKLRTYSNQLTTKSICWMYSKIDHEKLLSRIESAYVNPEKATKCVLLEYNFTSVRSLILGIPYLIEYIPGTATPIHCALTTPDFIRAVDEVFVGNNRKIRVYTRQKIKSDGTPDFNIKQLVVCFEPWAFIPNSSVCDCSSIYSCSSY